ncbi:MAG: Cof-type HAD-IIB family hydrolase [Burkholderiaceae bacterium]
MTLSHPIRCLVADVDGTLVTPDKEVTADARDAVRALKAAGVGFAFVSSRPPRGLQGIATALELQPDADSNGPRRPAAAAFNGGALLDSRLQPIAFEALGADDARIALDLFAAMGVDAWVFTLDDWILTDPAGHYVAHEQHTVGFAPRVVASFDGVTGIGKIVGSSADPDLLERAELALQPRLSTAARALRSQTYYLDVTNANADKGSALRAIAEHAGLALDEMAAIGDMVNDLAMLEIAGFAIAMGNAPAEVKAAADAVTASNSDEGFAKAVHALVLPRATKEVS